MPIRLYSLLVMFCMFILGIVYLPTMVSWDVLRPVLAEAIAGGKGQNDIAVTIMGPVGIELLPWPTITAQNVHITKKTTSAGDSTLLRVNKMAMGLQLQPLMNQQLIFQSITLAEGEVKWDLDPAEGNLWTKLSSHIRKFATSSFAIKLKDINLQLRKQSIGLEKTIRDVSMQILLNRDFIPTALYGVFNNLGEKMHVSGMLAASNSETSGMNWQFSSPSLQLHLTGQTPQISPTLSWKGEITAQLLNQQLFTKYLMPEQTNASIHAAAQDDPIELKGAISLNENGLWITGLKIATPNLYGSIGIEALFGEVPAIVSELKIDRLNMDKLGDSMVAMATSLVHTPDQQTEESAALGELAGAVFGSLSSKIKLDFIAHLNQVRYNNKVLAPFSVELKAENGKGSFAPVDLTLPFDTTLHMEGAVAPDAEITAAASPSAPEQVAHVSHTSFDSAFSLQSGDGENFYRWLLKKPMLSKDDNAKTIPHYFAGHVRLTNKEIRFYNLKGIFDNARYKGSVTIRRYQMPIYDVELEASQLDLGRWNADNKIKQFIVDLFSPITNRVPEDWWIKSYKNIINLDIALSDFTAQNSHYNRVEMMGHFEPGALRLEQLYVEHPEAQFKMSAFYDVRPLKPVINMDMGATYLSMAYFKNLMPELLKPIGILVDTKKGKDWSDKPLNLPRLDLFDGSLRVLCKKLHLDNDQDWMNVSLATSLRNSKLLVDRMKFEYLHGDINGNAEVIIQPFSVVGAVSYNNFNIHDLPYLVQFPASVTGGYGSISGTFGTSGSSIKAWVYNLSVSTALALRDMTLQGYGLDDFILHLNNATTRDKKMVDLLNAQAKADSKTTIIHNVDGNIIGKQGVFMLQDALMDSDYSRTALGGTINIRDRTLDIKGKNAFSLVNPKADMAFDISVTGPWALPKVVLDLSNLTSKESTKPNGTALPNALSKPLANAPAATGNGSLISAPRSYKWSEGHSSVQ